MSGQIVCECGCKTFGIRYFGEGYPPHCIGVNEYNGEEVVNNPLDDMRFTPDDRFNIWSWIVIDLRCAKSGKELKGFVDDELA